VLQGDSAIPGSRATGATTSTTTQDCDRPIDERKALPTVQVLSEVAKQVRTREVRVTVKPHTTWLPKQQEDPKGIRGERGWMLMNSHGIEFSIAGDVEEIVRDPNPKP